MAAKGDEFIWVANSTAVRGGWVRSIRANAQVLVVVTVAAGMGLLLR